MRQNQMLKITEGTRNELDGGRRREVLPITPREADSVEGSWLDYTLRDAVLLRPYFDLTRSGMKAEEVSAFILNGVDRIENGQFEFVDGKSLCLREPRGLLAPWSDEIWIAREVWTCQGIEEITRSSRRFSVTWYGGTKEEIFSDAAFNRRGFEARETLSIQLYNLTSARAKVIAAARAAGLSELDELDGAV